MSGCQGKCCPAAAAAAAAPVVGRGEKVKTGIRGSEEAQQQQVQLRQQVQCVLSQRRQLEEERNRQSAAVAATAAPAAEPAVVPVRSSALLLQQERASCSVPCKNPPPQPQQQQKAEGRSYVLKWRSRYESRREEERKAVLLLDMLQQQEIVADLTELSSVEDSFHNGGGCGRRSSATQIGRWRSPVRSDRKAGRGAGQQRSYTTSSCFTFYSGKHFAGNAAAWRRETPAAACERAAAERKNKREQRPSLWWWVPPSTNKTSSNSAAAAAERTSLDPGGRWLEQQQRQQQFLSFTEKPRGVAESSVVSIERVASKAAAAAEPAWRRTEEEADGGVAGAARQQHLLSTSTAESLLQVGAAADLIVDPSNSNTHASTRKRSSSSVGGGDERKKSLRGSSSSSNTTGQKGPREGGRGDGVGGDSGRKGAVGDNSSKSTWAQEKSPREKDKIGPAVCVSRDTCKDVCPRGRKKEGEEEKRRKKNKRESEVKTNDYRMRSDSSSSSSSARSNADSCCDEEEKSRVAIEMGGSMGKSRSTLHRFLRQINIFRLISFANRVRKQVGNRFFLLLLSVFILIRGVLYGLSHRGLLPYLKELHQDAGTYQTIDAMGSVIWGMMGMIGALSDAIPLGGYSKRYYMLIANLLGVCGVGLLAFTPSSVASHSVWIVGLGTFLLCMQVSTLVLMCSGKYSELMEQQPEMKADVVTFVFTCWMVGNLIGTSIVGPVSDAVGPKPLYYLAVPLAAQSLVPIFAGFLPEPKLPFQIMSSRLWKNRRFFAMAAGVGVVATGVVILTILDTRGGGGGGGGGGAAAAAAAGGSAAVAAAAEAAATTAGGNGSAATAAAASFSNITKTKEGGGTIWMIVYCGIASVFLMALCVYCLPGALARCNLYLFVWGLLNVSISGALDFFYTAKPSCLPDGPHFDYTYYSTYNSVVGTLANWVGIWVFHTFLRDWTFRQAFWLTIAVRCVASLFDYVMVLRLNVRVLGIPDKFMYMFGDAIIMHLVSTLNQMPCYILTSRLCPKGLESTAYAVMDGMSHIGWNFAKHVGVFIVKLAGISTVETAETMCNFDNLANVIIITQFALPLLAIPLSFFLLPNQVMSKRFDYKSTELGKETKEGKKKQEEEREESDGGEEEEEEDEHEKEGGEGFGAGIRREGGGGEQNKMEGEEKEEERGAGGAIERRRGSAEQGGGLDEEEEEHSAIALTAVSTSAEEGGGGVEEEEEERKRKGAAASICEANGGGVGDLHPPGIAWEAGAGERKEETKRCVVLIKDKDAAAPSEDIAAHKESALVEALREERGEGADTAAVRKAEKSRRRSSSSNISSSPQIRVASTALLQLYPRSPNRSLSAFSSCSCCLSNSTSAETAVLHCPQAAGAVDPSVTLADPILSSSPPYSLPCHSPHTQYQRLPSSKEELWTHCGEIATAAAATAAATAAARLYGGGGAGEQKAKASCCVSQQQGAAIAAAKTTDICPGATPLRVDISPAYSERTAVTAAGREGGGERAAAVVSTSTAAAAKQQQQQELQGYDDSPTRSKIDACPPLRPGAAAAASAAFSAFKERKAKTQLEQQRQRLTLLRKLPQPLQQQRALKAEDEEEGESFLKAGSGYSRFFHSRRRVQQRFREAAATAATDAAAE